MITIVNSCAFIGIDGVKIETEVDISKGVPSFEIVGLPDTAVKESKERVRSALKNAKIPFPPARYTVNLAPASIKKEGALFDFPIAAGILSSMRLIPTEALTDKMVIGELSLNGEIRPVSGILAAAIAAKQNGMDGIFVPAQNAAEAAVIEGLSVYPCESLTAFMLHCTGEQPILPFRVDSAIQNSAFQSTLDFSEVKGQEAAKRALEIAAAGGHNCLMVGSPGTGKTMLAKRLPTILPDLTFEESLEVTKIHSISGMLPDNTPLMCQRPFRSPHHTISANGMSGGGRVPRPGEVSLAHHGVLFLDELPEFHKDTLEVLRQPLEDSKITISRVASTLTYPCNIMLITAMNPCRCGFLNDPHHECTCSPHQVQQYMAKISGPLLDRIDIHIEVNPIMYEDLENKTAPSVSSAEMKERVCRARAIQASRFAEDGIFTNAQMQERHILKYCALGEAENNMLKKAFDRLGLSARAYNRILKVARTIADLDGSADILKPHLAEAISYRSMDRKLKNA
ncbi:MAG: YifB family Mg chelatase-like AAA ATPase [Clostridia bacterium]|nr:YifB family Mg chelatase-like AAA ATPase [Clostridia bacterium]